MPRGRPRSVTPAIRAEVLRRLADGELLMHILNTVGMPSRHSIHRAIEADEDFRAEYARARELGAESMVEQGLQIAHDGSSDALVGEDGQAVPNHVRVARDRLRWDAIRWAAGKFNAKRFGDKVQAEVDGKLEITVTRQYADQGDSNGT